MGCGGCEEGYVLNGYFGNKSFGLESPDVFVVNPQYQFIHGDARDLRKLVDGEFDVVVARHPHLAKNDHCALELADMWRTIFKESRGVLKPDGLYVHYSFCERCFFRQTRVVCQKLRSSIVYEYLRVP